MPSKEERPQSKGDLKDATELEGIVNEYIDKMVDTVQLTKPEADAEIVMLASIMAGIAAELKVLVAILKRM